jgi:hypothetical protein
MHKNSPSINERKKNVTFVKSVSTSFLKATGEYSLKQSFFDPTKNSPPNEFMIKLYMRDDLYNIKK